MNIGAKIGIGVGVLIVIIVLVLALNVYAISNLQIQAQEMGNFDLLDLSMDGKFVACNPTFFPASFNTFSVDIVYKSTNFGTFTVWGKTIPPSTPITLDGRLNLNGESVMQLLIAAFGSVFGGDEFEFDPNQIRYIAKLDAPILGIIPFSVSETYTPTEFMDIIGGQTGEWSCGPRPQTNIFEQMQGGGFFNPGGQNSLEDTFEQPKQKTEPTKPSSPPGAGTLGDEHEHAAILVRIHGDKFEFSSPAYQIKSSWIHFEGADGNTVHRHSSGVTMGYLFETLGLTLTDECYVFQSQQGKRDFCTNDDYILRFYINELSFPSIHDYVIQDNDRILIVYGTPDAFSDAGYLEELERIPIETASSKSTSQSTPSVQPSQTTQTNCDPSYPDVCIPLYPPDLDCGDISFRNFKVLPPDQHRFDGDKDGIGCEL